MGLSKIKSTTALLSVTCDWLLQLDKMKESVFFDFRKAFDTIDSAAEKTSFATASTRLLAGVTVYCVARIFCRARRNILGYFVATQA